MSEAPPYYGTVVTAIIARDKKRKDVPNLGFYVTSPHPGTNGACGLTEDALVTALEGFSRTYGARVVLSTVPGNPKDCDSTLKWLLREPTPIEEAELDVIDGRINSAN